MEPPTRDDSSVATTISLVGASFSGNKGAAAMLVATIDGLRERLSPCRIDVLTSFPAEDAARGAALGVRIAPFRAWSIPISFALALLAWVLARLGLSTRPVCLTGALRSVRRAEVVVDLAGISFADGRGLPILVYNVMMTSIPLLLGRPTVKVSQAIGSFEEATTRLAARAVLPRVTRIGARGPRTAAHLRQLGLDNYEEVDDIAFCLTVPEPAQRRSADLIAGMSRPLVAIVPSMVVEEYVHGLGIDHRAALTDLIDGIIETEAVDVLLVPHALHRSAPASRTNDLPLCRDVYGSVSKRSSARLVDEDLGPGELRAVIGRCDLLITARFHGMVSGLATATPMLVISWSHKYREVLEAFGIADALIDHGELADPDGLLERVRSVLTTRHAQQRLIEEALPGVRARADRNFDLILEALR